MTIVGQDYHRRKGRFYGCSYYKTRGSSICKNSLLVEQEFLDQIVLKSLHEALTEEMLKVAVEKALAKHRAGEGAKLDRRTNRTRAIADRSEARAPRRRASRPAIKTGPSSTA